MMLIKILLTFISPSLAVIANPNTFDAYQPDNTYIQLHVNGDEYFNWYEDTKGYIVSKISEPTLASSLSGDVYKYVYIDKQNYPTDYMVGKVNPDSFKTILMKQVQVPTVDNTTTTTERRRQTNTNFVTNVNNMNCLLLLIRWNDCKITLPDVNQYNTLINGDNYSVKDLYLVNSNGKFTLNGVVTPWITSNYSETTVAQNSCYGCTLHQAIYDILDTIDNMYDLRIFDQNNDGWVDSIGIIHSGYGAEFNGDKINHIWSHKWGFPKWTSKKTGIQITDYFITSGLWGTSGNQMARIGTFSHEFGHYLGLPDLYDTEYDGRGLGKYSLMANSWGFDGSQMYPGMLDAWSRTKLGWANVVEITQPGEYTLLYPTVYKISRGFPVNEYLLLENRQASNYDRTLPTSGIAIYHIDDNMNSYYSQGFPNQLNWPYNGKHYRVALLQADGLYELERNANSGDLKDFYSNYSRLSPYTNPNTNSYQNGNLKMTGIDIIVSSSPSNIMSFTVNFVDVQTTQIVPPITTTQIVPPITTTTTQIVATTVAIPVTTTQTVVQTQTITQSLKTLKTTKITLQQIKSGTMYYPRANIVVYDDKNIIVNDIKVDGYFIHGTVLYKVTGNNVVKCANGWKTLDKSLLFCITNIVKSGYIYQSTNTCVKYN